MDIMVGSCLKKKASKIAVGADEFCPKCMEWREFDDEGRCRVCGKAIRKGSKNETSVSEEYDLTDFSSESGEEQQ